MLTVKDIENKDLVFTNSDCEVETIKTHLGKKAKEFDSFFVHVRNGDYAEVYGMMGSVPYLNRQVVQLVPSQKEE
jgi:hypothetical protein